MFLTVHAATGIIIGQYVPNPLFAFIIGFVSHYIFDIIPHGDSKAPEKYKNPIHIAFAGIIDLVVLSLFLIFLFFNQVELLRLNILLAVLGSMLPDILQAFYFVYRKKIFKKLQIFHNFWHDLISHKYAFPLWLGLSFQLLLLIIFTIIII